MKKILLIFLLNLVLSFPLFHYIYIHGNPGSGDYDNYVEMVKKPLDLSSTDAPFVIRQFTPMVSYFLYSNNIFYNSFTTFTNDLDKKKIYFSLLSVNYLGILLCMCFLTWLMFHHNITNHLFINLLPGLFLLLAYKTIFVGIYPLTEGFGVLMSLILFYLYENKLSVISFVFFCCLAIFVREITLLFITIYITTDLFKNFLSSKKIKHILKYLIPAILFCFFYLLIRKYFITYEGYSKQIDISNYYANISNFIKNLTIIDLAKIFFYQTILIIITCHFITYKKSINFKKFNPLIISVVILSIGLIMIGLTSYGLPRFISSLNAVYLYSYIKNYIKIKTEGNEKTLLI